MYQQHVHIDVGSALFCAVIATVCIFSVLSCVGATVHGLGWTLGFLESICFSVLIGLSVDFVIHFAHAFSHAPPAEAKDGDGRARHSLRTMSKAILSAGFTTAAASVMLMVCEIQYMISCPCVDQPLERSQ